MSKPSILARAFSAIGVTSAVSNIKARYDAAGTGRRMRGWNAPSSGPNTATAGLQNIRNRARDSSRNDWPTSAASQRWVTNLVGTGIVPRLAKTVSKTRKAKIQAMWDEWCANADADGVMGFYGLQALATRAWLESGEVFVRIRYRDDSYGLRVPVQLQVIEAEFVPPFDADSWPGLPETHTIRQGIERDRRGKRIAYWCYREHPGEFHTAINSDANLLRIPADEMLHIYEPKRPGQLRGVPEFAPILARIRNIQNYDDAVQERMTLSNMYVGFITTPAPSGYTDDIDPLTGEPIDTGPNGEPMIGLQPGTTQQLLPGENIQWSNPPEAGTTYSDFMRTQHVGTAAGSGVPYELMSGDIINISDRTLRIVIQEFRRHVEQRQWTVVIPMLCQKVRDVWAAEAALSGELSVREAEDAKRVTWTPQGWAYIHPTQDAQAEQMLIEAGLSSRTAAISKRGDDPEIIDEERAEDAKREAELGLPATNQPKTAAGVAPANDQQPTEGEA